MAKFGTAGLIRGSTTSTSHFGPSTRDSARCEFDESMANSTNCSNLKHGYNSAADGYIPGKLPLPNDYFPVPQLTARENRYLLGLAKHTCKEVVYFSRQDDGPMKWLHLSSTDGVDVFQGVDTSGSNRDGKALTYLRGSCKIHATLDEVSNFFKLDTPEKLSGFSQTVGRDLLDQKTLLTLATPTLENPKHYVAVKWTAVESPNKVARNRDFCYIECHDEFIDANTKRRGWVQSMHSIRLPFCPPLTQSHNLVRGSLYRSGYTFTESADEGYLEAIHTLHVDIKGHVPNWLKILTMKRRITNFAKVNHYFQRQRLIHETLLGEMDLPAKDLVTQCQLCTTRFGFFHRRHLCRKCGKVVCNSCGTKFLLDTNQARPTRVRICLKCTEYEGNVPVMDASVLVADAKKQRNHDPSCEVEESMIYLEQSFDEHESCLDDEDAKGLADIEEAKRTNIKFNELLKETSECTEATSTSRNFDLMSMRSYEMEGGFGEADRASLNVYDLGPYEDPVDARTEKGVKNYKIFEHANIRPSDDRSQSRSRSSHEFEPIPPRMLECQTRTQLRYETRNARLNLVPDSAYRASDFGTEVSMLAQRQQIGLELEPRYNSMSEANLNEVDLAREQQNDEVHDPEKEALRLAMSAMRLYEEERGPKLHMAKETRQVALAKMMEVYAREIRQSNDFSSYTRGTISNTYQAQHDAWSSRQMRRTFGDDRSPYDASPLQDFRQNERHFPLKGLCNLETSTLRAEHGASEKAYEDQNLSDRSPSAFQAFQRSSRGSRATSQVPVKNSDRDDMYDQNEEAQAVTVDLQPKSTSTICMQIKSDKSDMTRHSSMETSNLVTTSSRSNSMFEVADSDTFSDMDLTDFPHLMCKDDNCSQMRSSLSNVQHWSENEGLEYVEEPGVSDLLVSLHLDDVQQVEDDDSVSQSSTSSSHINTETSVSNEVPLGQCRAAAEPGAMISLIIKNELSESMDTHNEQLGYRHQYSKLPSLLDLLSELCGSERSSLPSYLEFGGSHSELEPEYLEAIANASKGIIGTMEGERRRRRSSIPSKLEAMVSREGVKFDGHVAKIRNRNITL